MSVQKRHEPDWLQHFHEELTELIIKLNKVCKSDLNIQNLIVKCEELQSTIKQLKRLSSSDDTARETVIRAFGEKDTILSIKELKELEIYIATMHTPVRKVVKKIVPILQPLVIVMTPAVSVYLAVLEIDENEVGTDSVLRNVLFTIFGIMLFFYLLALFNSKDSANVLNLRIVVSDSINDSNDACHNENCCCTCYNILSRPGKSIILFFYHLFSM